MQFTQVLAQIANGIIEYANRSGEAGSQGSFRLDQILGRFDQQAGRIHFLDRAVVKLARNPFALVSHHLIFLHRLDLAGGFQRQKFPASGWLSLQ